ncbi:glycosyltransferase family 4 protein [Microtetraspora malaysiensis]|uniref:Glycosyltransferase family 4 protein n=1 Tax=Microtetraspora malaysiensis TaxID=161358 RepID=A0ABW6SKS6_9ACTN
MRRALLYCTFNGVANCTNGIGRQTQTLLTALSNRWDELVDRTGPFTPFLAIPTPGPLTWAYDPARLAASRAVVTERGGEVLSLDHDATAFWTPATWRQLSAGAAETALALTDGFDQVAVIAVDTPFAGTGAAYRDRSPNTATGVVRILTTLYGTTHIHDHPIPNPDRLAWERYALAATHSDVYIADIGGYLTQHLVTDYGLDPARFLPWRSSLDLTAEDLHPMPAPAAAQVAATFGISLDRPIVLTIGRTDPTKGIDLLIDALRPLRDQVHLVAIVVPFDGDDPLLRRYRHQITDAGLHATLIPEFTRTLPRALASLSHTAVVACPARGESLANVPFETALWARHGGPVVVAPNRDGFPEQITHGETGLLYEPDQEGELTAAIRDGIALDPRARERMTHAAYQRVAADRDVIPNLADMLNRLLPPASADAR